MLSDLKERLTSVRPQRGGMITQGMTIVLLVSIASAPAAAQDVPYDAIVGIVDIILALIIAVALVNGALGLLQYMTSGSNIERSSAGKERLYKTGAALIGATIIKGLVGALGSAVADSAGVDNPLEGQ